VSPETWTLTIDGMVDRPVELTFAELLKMPLTEADITLVCVSNQVGGTYNGNATWLGVAPGRAAPAGRGCGPVFAPDNAAFAKIPPATLKKLLANKAELTKILTYHVAPARYTPAQLSSGTAIKTLEGGMVTPGRDGQHLRGQQGQRGLAGTSRPPTPTVYIIDNRG